VQCKMSVKLWTPAKRPRGAGRFAAGLLMFVLWLGVYALTVSPQLHHLLHEDAQCSAHTCLITQLQKQPALGGCVTVAAPAPVLTEIDSVRASDTQFVPAFDYRLSPSRAPPLSVSFRYA